ncbi:MAG: GNAT family N-acetyltransferase [Tepidisphaeraceae bacterium]
MSLPILSVSTDPRPADLVRFYHRTELHWSRHLGEETTLDVGTAIANPDLPSVADANVVLDATLAEGTSAADAIAEVESHFAAQRARCAKWVFAAGQAESRIKPLVDRLVADGYSRRAHNILHLSKQPAGTITEVAGLKIIPARASYRHARALADEWAVECGEGQLADAMMLHLDDPHTDALVALRDGRAVAQVSVLSVGDLGCVEDLFVSAAFRRQGVGRTMMGRAMEICARSLFKHVFVGAPDDNAAAQALYGRFGFRKVGEYVSYVSAHAS